uniref:VWDE-like Ig-like domain-containing protein n=1 Tax=Melopsittacus undulatus TaxID=13146 RepID=A0A8C6ILK7_MELUD
MIIIIGGIPECSQEGHHILHNPYHSTKLDSLELQRTAIQDLVCDHSLPPAWYRFMTDNKPAEMPTRCVEMNKCGTQAPMWLPLKSESLPVPGENKRLMTCVTWQTFFGGIKDCCLFRIPIPMIGPRLVQGRVYLKCTFSCPSSKPPLQYVVVRSRLSTSGKKDQIQRDTTLQSFSYIEMNSNKLQIGRHSNVTPRSAKKVKHSRGSNPFLKSLFCFY